jgi:hypothetical protein
MTDESLTISLTTGRTPDEAFAAVNDVRGWWTGEIDGPTDEPGAEFTYRHQDIHRSHRLRLHPGRRRHQPAGPNRRRPGIGHRPLVLC